MSETVVHIRVVSVDDGCCQDMLYLLYLLYLLYFTAFASIRCIRRLQIYLHTLKLTDAYRNI
jgi:hypothetical protein